MHMFAKSNCAKVFDIMCRTTNNSIITEIKSDGGGTSVQTAMIVFCGVVTVTSLATSIVFGNMLGQKVAPVTVPAPTVVINNGAAGITENTFTSRRPRDGENECLGKKVSLDNIDCLTEALENVLPQAGGNVTMGFRGEMNVGHEPIKTPYFQNEMCPVNVHWHLGTEHLSAGEFDEMGKGPHTKPGDMRRKLAGYEDVRGGFRCHHYDENDPKFTTPYDWQHCVGMEVGETYEVHWPHSAAGACGTINQWQTPFYDGVLCRIEILGDLSRIQEQVGVQAQVFTIVNDEDYFYSDLMRGMIVDGDMGTEITKYTGSTTGTSRNNEICSAYAPITWQVDRKCHMISASTFDKMCADMKSQRSDMSDDLYAHGSRELVDPKFTANNQHNRALRGN